MNASPFQRRRVSRGHSLPPRAACLSCLILAIFGGFPDATAQNHSSGQVDFTGFKSISERNIFDATRSARSSTRSEMESAPQIDTIRLYGTFIYDKGPFALFTGSSSEYRQELTVGKSIAGYTIAEISGSGVTLTAGAQRIELRVGMELRREEGGEWQVAGSSAATVIGGNSTRAVDASSSSDQSDVVKRMMKQREQDLK